MRKTFTRSIAAAVAAATIVTSIPLSQAVAAFSAAPAVATAAPVTSDFSTRRYRRGGGNAAALGAFAAIIGTIGAVAIAQQRNDDYGRYGYYGNGYGYGAPVPYGYYGRRW